jgi:hypothetical protein
VGKPENLTVADNSNLDYEATSSYTLSIEVFDGVHAAGQDVTVAVSDVLETKFFVVDESSDRMFEYDAAGGPVEDSSLVSDNSDSRGAAADGTGSTVWVIDNNDYVYDSAGALQGQWKAEGLNRPEGIATDGTDVWIVDRGLRRVLRFDGGAGFTSGNHSADSSFSLNKTNRSAKGVTTDGMNLWVVDARKNAQSVFKYSVSGTLLGSWSIDGQNDSPQGITIDPTSVDTIWIVDEGTGQVFQYSGAASRTSGSQSADAAFDLAASNSNPSGIADPPTVQGLPLHGDFASARVVPGPASIVDDTALDASAGEPGERERSNYGGDKNRQELEQYRGRPLSPVQPAASGWSRFSARSAKIRDAVFAQLDDDRHDAWNWIDLF